MKLLYCYVAFMDRDGSPKPFRGMSELELNFSATDVYHHDRSSDILRRSPRETPLPDHFWANGSAGTNIYNINVLAGVNGAGKSSAIHYLMDLLNYIYSGCGQTLSDQDRYFRHNPHDNRNLLLFDTNDGLRILDLKPQDDKTRLRLEDFPVSPLFLRPTEAEILLRGMKVINLSNTLTQRDYGLHSGTSERLRNNFIYDCTLGAAIGSDIGGFFPYEVYKQVAYLFEPHQADMRGKMEDQIPEMRLPRALRLKPLEKRFEKAIAALTDIENSAFDVDFLIHAPISFRLAILCAVSYVENMIALLGHSVLTYPHLMTFLKTAVQMNSETLCDTLIEFVNQAEKWLKRVLGVNIVSGSWDKTLRVWDINSGECVQKLEGHEDSIICITVLPDGSLVSGSRDNNLYIWKNNSTEYPQALKGHEDSVTCTALLPDGRLVSGSYDNTLRVWDISSGKCIQILKGHEAYLTCITVLPNGYVVSGSLDKTVRIWDINRGECLHTLQGHTDCVTCVIVLPNEHVISGSRDSTLRIWDTNSGKCLKTLNGHESSVTCMTILHDGRVVSGSVDKTLRVWDIRSRKCIQTLVGHEASVTCVTGLPDGRVISGSGSSDKTLRVWDVQSGKCLQTLKGHKNTIICMTLLPDGRIVSGSDDNTLRVWDLNKGECQETLSGHTDRISCVDILPNEQVKDDRAAKLINDRAKQCREYIKYVLHDPSGLFLQFIQSDMDPDIYELPIPYGHLNSSKCIEESLIKFLDLYHKICTPYYTLDFDWGLSSGEENMLRLFSWLFHIFPRAGENGEYRYQIRNNPKDIYDGGYSCDSVLMFMDEADLTFHPEWQRRLIHILTAFLPTIYPSSCVKDLQLVLTTHSPLLLGDIPRENIHFLSREDDNDVQNIDNRNETFGQNIHTILRDSFFLKNGTVGQFAANKIDKLAEQLNKQRTGEAESVLSTSEIESIHRTVSLVAPGVLRTKLEQLLREAVSHTNSPDMDMLIKQTKRLSKEERKLLLRQLQEDSKA